MERFWPVSLGQLFLWRVPNPPECLGTALKYLTWSPGEAGVWRFWVSAAASATMAEDIVTAGVQLRPVCFVTIDFLKSRKGLFLFNGGGGGVMKGSEGCSP